MFSRAVLGEIAPNAYERALSAIAPKRARETYLTRMAFQQAGQYAGARHDRTALRNFQPGVGSADTDSIGDLPALRARSRDLVRNTSLARGARNTSRVNVVGAGLRVSAQLQREVLGLTDAQAEAWEDRAEVLFDLWASSKMADVTRAQNFYEMQGVAFNAAFESGDAFAVRRFKEGASFLALCLQLVEADRVSTPTDKQFEPAANIHDGIEQDDDGEAVAYHFRNRHPGDDASLKSIEPERWDRVTALGKETGERQVIHLFDRDRIGLSRGVPMLAPVIEDLKQLDRYAEAELMAAVVSAFFTVFIKSDSGTAPEMLGESDSVVGPALPSNQIALGSGSVVELAGGESIETANPARPNANFDPFYLAIVRKIGVSLGIPYEVLIMHFTASYSASRAALETAWQFFTDRRTWLERNFCQPVYEWFIYEAVARGLLQAPGFFDDPMKRAAWCGSKWIGPARIVLDPAKEAAAEEKWIAMGVKTLEGVTINQTGGDWWRNQEQRGREVALRRSLELEASVPEGEPILPTDDKPNEGDKE